MALRRTAVSDADNKTDQSPWNAEEWEAIRKMLETSNGRVFVTKEELAEAVKSAKEAREKA